MDHVIHYNARVVLVLHLHTKNIDNPVVFVHIIMFIYSGLL